MTIEIVVMTDIAIEHGHRNGGFSHEKHVFFSQPAILNHQRVMENQKPKTLYIPMGHGSHGSSCKFCPAITDLLFHFAINVDVS